MNIGLAALLAILAIAVASDALWRKVPNALVAGGLVFALAYHGLGAPGNGILHGTAGAIGLASAAGGIAVGFAALLPLYAMRAMGAGDVKLMMVVGAFLGPLQTSGAVLLTFAAGGVLAIVVALWQRALGQLVVNLRVMLTMRAIRSASGLGPSFEPLQQTAARLPYALAIAAGTSMQWMLVRSGGWTLG